MTDARFPPSTMPRALAALAIGLGVFIPTAVHAQTSKPIAELLFRQGQEKMAARDYDAACDLFGRSYKVDPALGTLLNLAICHERQGKIATAWSEFSEGEARATRDSDDRRAELARTHRIALEKGLHKIVIEIMTPAAGIHVSLDGTELPREVLGTALPLDPGEHRIDAVADGRAPFVRKINLGPSGGTDRIEVILEPVAATPQPGPGPAPTLPPLPRPAASADGSGRRIGGWVGIGVGAVGAGLAVGFGVKMAMNASERDRLCPPGVPCANQAAYSADHAARVDRVVMLVSGGIGLAALGVGVGLLVSSRSKSPVVSRVEVTPWVGATGAGFGARGAF